jgi:hypothetical protein
VFAYEPDFMILSGRYITASPPSSGLVVTVDQVHVLGFITRVVTSGPASRMRPSESWKRNGYSGVVSRAPVRSCHVFVDGS